MSGMLLKSQLIEVWTNVMHFLTHGGWGKMASILQMTFSKAFMNENISIAITISLKFVRSGPIDNISVLVQTILMGFHVNV